MPAAGFPETEHPRLDGYVLLHKFLEEPQDDLEALDRQADELSGLLMSQSGITAHLRRIACVDIKLGADSMLHGTCCGDTGSSAANPNTRFRRCPAWEFGRVRVAATSESACPRSRPVRP